MSFDFLKCSKLVEPDISPEEISIWLDMNMQDLHDMLNAIKCIYDSTYSHNDNLIKSSDEHWYKHESEIMFMNIFKAAFIAKSLDKFILDGKFISAIEKLKTDARKHVNMKTKGRVVSFVSHKHLVLFETMSEMLERIDKRKDEIASSS